MKYTNFFYVFWQNDKTTAGKPYSGCNVFDLEIQFCEFIF